MQSIPVTKEIYNKSKSKDPITFCFNLYDNTYNKGMTYEIFIKNFSLWSMAVVKLNIINAAQKIKEYYDKKFV